MPENYDQHALRRKSLIERFFTNSDGTDSEVDIRRSCERFELASCRLLGPGCVLEADRMSNQQEGCYQERTVNTYDDDGGFRLLRTGADISWILYGFHSSTYCTVLSYSPITVRTEVDFY